MKTKLFFPLALIALFLTISCKDKSAESLTDSSESASSEIVSDTVNAMSSSAAQVDKNENRKFVRTADVRFKVKNVIKSTEVIEDAARKFGGFVTSTDLHSNILNQDETDISSDSTLVVTRFMMENTMTIRVPNIKMDTVIKTIARQVHFLNYRIIKADDVTLQIMSNQMAQKRNESSQKRIASAIDHKGQKLNQIIDGEANLESKNEQKDTKKLENLSLQDQINFSTIALQIYQDESIRQELIPNKKTLNDFNPHFGYRILESVKTGWFVLEYVISFIVLLWPFALIGTLGYFGYQRYLKMK